jgi:tetratricopeptide (TPR) repeat protein
MTRRCVSWAVLLAAVTLPLDASAVSIWPFKPRSEVLLEQARGARERSEFRLADSLLEEAEGQLGSPRALILHERGLLARDRGQLDEAATLLGRAADRAPSSSARVDRAGVLVQLGRWPEAVTVLRAAFDERGTALRVDDVIADRRFVKLADFAPYKDLIEKVREEQSGPIGKLLLRLQRIEASARVAADILERVAAVMAFLYRLASALGAAIVALIFLGLLVTFGVHQLGLLKPPWTLFAGMTVASVLWHLGSRVATADASGGWPTIGIAMAIVCAPWIMYIIGRGLWRWRRARVEEATDPFSREHLAHTLAVIDEVSRVGHKMLEAGDMEAEAIDEDLRSAERALRRRLSRGAA